MAEDQMQAQGAKEQDTSEALEAEKLLRPGQVVARLPAAIAAAQPWPMPSIGRIVHFVETEGEPELAGIVTRVHTPSCINLYTFQNGGLRERTSVLQDERGTPGTLALARAGVRGVNGDDWLRAAAVHPRDLGGTGGDRC